jgi:hypothetical protein
MGSLKSDQGQLFYEFRLGDAVPERSSGLGWLEVECNRCKTRASCRSMQSAGCETRRYGNWKLP